MKRVIILLILANVVLYVWRSNSQEQMAERGAPPPAEMERLVLMSERPPNTNTEEVVPQSDEVAVSEPAPVSAPEPTPVAACYSLGPFPEKSDAEKIAAVLNDAGVESGIRTITVIPKSGLMYLVFLPTAERNQAKKLAGELREKGVRDFYVGGTNFVALGVFSTHERAMRRAESLKKMGYTVAIKQEGDTTTQYWVDAVQTNPDALTPEKRKAMLASYDKAGEQAKGCGEIALNGTKP